MGKKRLLLASAVLFCAVLIRVLCSESFFDRGNGCFSDYDDNGNLIVENTKSKVVFYDYDSENHLRSMHIIDMAAGTQEFIDFTK